MQNRIPVAMEVCIGTGIVSARRLARYYITARRSRLRSLPRALRFTLLTAWRVQ